MSRRLAVAAVIAALLSAAPAVAAPPEPSAAEEKLSPEDAAKLKQITDLLKSLKPQTGSVLIPEAKARLALGEAYYFLGEDDARKVLVDLWGNPPEAVEGVLGMIFPKDASPAGDTWGAVVTWKGDGYVSDKDAKTTDYDKVLADMRQGEEQDNQKRQQMGYDTISLVGWAQAPAYDAARHSLIWARELAIGGSETHGLNYDVRVLGREGVLSLNIVSSMDRLAEVKAAAQGVERAAVFEPGARYADYKQGDRRAAYGVAGLIAAGVGVAAVKKAGMLGLLLLAVKKFGVFILMGLGVAGTWIGRQWKRLFGGGRDAADVG